jgi:methylmalonyl-CoA/ethylmalonyl-CoA epimerase
LSTNEFRVALTTDNFLQAVRFYSDGLGLDAGELWTGNGNGQVFWAGKAALEIFDPAYAAGVDQVEVGNQISGQIRFAFQVNDIHQALAKALKYGGVLINGPVLTPWNDLIVRIQSPEWLQITLFQEPQK